MESLFRWTIFCKRYLAVCFNPDYFFYIACAVSRNALDWCSVFVLLGSIILKYKAICIKSKIEKNCPSFFFYCSRGAEKYTLVLELFTFFQFCPYIWGFNFSILNSIWFFNEGTKSFMYRKKKKNKETLLFI
jgi:hypothetical protein